MDKNLEMDGKGAVSYANNSLFNFTVSQLNTIYTKYPYLYTTLVL